MNILGILAKIHCRDQLQWIFKDIYVLQCESRLTSNTRSNCIHNRVYKIVASPSIPLLVLQHEHSNVVIIIIVVVVAVVFIIIITIINNDDDDYYYYYY